ncbi:MAG: ATP-binding protein [Saprospiraceae bacterium]
MNFVNQLEDIIQVTETPNELAFNCANFLIPKIMYIPHNQLDILKRRINTIQENHDCSIANFSLFSTIHSFLNYRKSNYLQVIEALENSLFENPKMDSFNQMCHYAAIGASLRSLGERDLALDAFQNVIKFSYSEIKEPFQQYFYGISLYHVSEIYGELKDFQEMLNKQQIFNTVANRWGNVDFENRSLNGIGRAYLGLKLYDAALEYLIEADEKCKVAANIPFIARNLNDLGCAYAKNENFEKALEHYKAALKIRKENNFTNATITTLINLGNLYIQLDKIKEAFDIFQEALITAKPLKVNRKLSTIYQQLSLVHERLEEHKIALEYHKKFHELKEELDNVTKTQVENQKVREINIQLNNQKQLIQHQKQQIETTLEKLKVTNKYLENFASVAAHDLKAPIRIAANFAKILERKYKNKFDKSDLEYFSFISNNVALLSRMIDDLLALSKLDQNLPRPKRVNTQHLIDEVTLRLNDNIQKYNATIQIKNELPTLKGHTSLLTQLFQNFIDNGMKYSQDNIPPVITISSICDEKTSFCQFEIRDNGQGISEQDQPFIFELFNGTYRNDSSGIGLATCKKIITHYGGNVWLKSKENQGTSIFFTLPIYLV